MCILNTLWHITNDGVAYDTVAQHEGIMLLGMVFLTWTMCNMSFDVMSFDVNHRHVWGRIHKRMSVRMAGLHSLQSWHKQLLWEKRGPEICQHRHCQAGLLMSVALSGKGSLAFGCKQDLTAWWQNWKTQADNSLSATAGQKAAAKQHAQILISFPQRQQDSPKAVLKKYAACCADSHLEKTAGHAVQIHI